MWFNNVKYAWTAGFLKNIFIRFMGKRDKIEKVPIIGSPFLYSWPHISSHLSEY